MRSLWVWMPSSTRWPRSVFRLASPISSERVAMCAPAAYSSSLVGARSELSMPKRRSTASLSVQMPAAERLVASNLRAR